MTTKLLLSSVPRAPRAGGWFERFWRNRKRDFGCARSRETPFQKKQSRSPREAWRLSEPISTTGRA